MSQVEYDVDDEKEKNEEDEEQYVAVEEDPTEDQDVDDDDEHEDDEEEEETRLGGGREEDDDDPDAKRRARRAENKSRRQRQKEARERSDRELRFLRNRNEQLERRFSEFEQETDARITGSEVAGIDAQLNKAKGDLALANQVIAQAADNNDGKNLAEALDHRDAIRDNLRDLEQAKEYLKEERRPAPQQDLDPRHVAHAQQFMMDHDWWDPSGRDQDSQQVLMIDRSLVQEGFDPRNKDYWDELRTRTQDALPDHFQRGGGRDDDEGDTDTGNGKPKRQRQKGPQFRAGGRERPLQKNEVYISPERREAMEEAGVWDDPVLRNKYLKAYADYDRNAEGGV